MKTPFKSQAELAKLARERAEKEAEARGIRIDRICIRATPWGSMKVIVLDQPVRG